MKRVRFNSPLKNRRSGRSVLATVTVLFLASLAIRLAETAGPAIAREVGTFSREGTVAAEPATCEQPPHIAEIMSTLKTREEDLDARLADVLEHENILAMSKQAVEAKIRELEDAEQKLADMIALSQTASEDDLARLTSVYENMKPLVAAELFAQMDPEFAAGFIGRMRPEPAASIMTGLAAEKAYAISVILAGRNANAPSQ